MKKVLKNVLPYLLISAIVALPLTGCSSSASSKAASSKTPVKLSVAWWGNQVRNKETTAMLNEYTKENPNVTFDNQYYDWGSYWDKLATASAGNHLPDIIQMDYSYLSQYVKSGLLLDLTPYTENKKIDVSSISKNVLVPGSINDKVYAICAGVNAPALLYNKTICDKAGVTIKDNMTVDDFISISNQIYKKTGYKTDMDYQTSSPLLEYFLRADNKVLYQEGKLGVDNASQLNDAFFSILEQGHKAGWLIDASVFTERNIASVEQSTLVYGSTPDTRSWCSFTFSNLLGAFKNVAKDFDIGITTYPSKKGTVSDYLKPSMFFCVSAKTQNPDESVKMLNYITNSEACNNILLGERGVPASSKIASAISSKVDATNKQVFSYINNVVTPNSTPINPPSPNGSNEANNVLAQLEEQLYYGKITAKEASQEYYTKANSLLASKK